MRQMRLIWAFPSYYNWNVTAPFPLPVPEDTVTKKRAVIAEQTCPRHQYSFYRGLLWKKKSRFIGTGIGHTSLLGAHREGEDTRSLRQKKNMALAIAAGPPTGSGLHALVSGK